MRLASLVDLTVVQGEPRTIEVALPNGYEVASVTGSSIETSDDRSGRLVLTLNNPTLRRPVPRCARTGARGRVVDAGDELPRGSLSRA